MDVVLREMLTTDVTHATRAWKVFFLLPRWLLWRPLNQANSPLNTASIVRQRLHDFHQGRWAALHNRVQPLSSRSATGLSPDEAPANEPQY